jgi:tripartite-type tricarboxylate transporter receptor subunit TctC
VHVAIESFAAEADVTLLQVPFKDAGTAFTAVANNDVDFTAISWNSVAGLLKAGKLRPLAVAAQTRSSEAPEVPTLAQAGAPSVEMRPWAALIDADRVRFAALVRSGRVTRN